MIKEEVRSRIFKRRQLKYIQMNGVLVDIDRNIIEALHDLGQRGSGTRDDRTLPSENSGGLRERADTSR